MREPVVRARGLVDERRRARLRRTTRARASRGATSGMRTHHYLFLLRASEQSARRSRLLRSSSGSSGSIRVTPIRVCATRAVRGGGVGHTWVRPHPRALGACWPGETVARRPEYDPLVDDLSVERRAAQLVVPVLDLRPTRQARRVPSSKPRSGSTTSASAASSSSAATRRRRRSSTRSSARAAGRPGSDRSSPPTSSAGSASRSRAARTCRRSWRSEPRATRSSRARPERSPGARRARRDRLGLRARPRPRRPRREPDRPGARLRLRPGARDAARARLGAAASRTRASSPAPSTSPGTARPRRTRTTRFPESHADARADSRRATSLPSTPRRRSRRAPS